jgi:hypothetical protein
MEELRNFIHGYLLMVDQDACCLIFNVASPFFWESKTKKRSMHVRVLGVDMNTASSV